MKPIIFLTGVKKNWEKVSRVIATDYCEIRDSRGVRERFNYYRQNGLKSPMKEYLEDAPTPQLFETLCSTKPIL